MTHWTKFEINDAKQIFLFMQDTDYMPEYEDEIELANGPMLELDRTVDISQIWEPVDLN